MKTRLGQIGFVLLVCLLGSSLVWAHPGRTDSSGCHTCRTNCSKWRLSDGEYHCHGGTSSSSDRSPASSSPSLIPTPTPTIDLTNPSFVAIPEAYNEKGIIVGVESCEYILVECVIGFDKVDQNPIVATKSVRLVGVKPFPDAQNKESITLNQKILSALQDMLKGQPVIMRKYESGVESKDTSVLRRFVWWKGSRLLNVDMVLYGYGMIEASSLYKANFEVAQKQAQTQQIGMWAIATKSKDQGQPQSTCNIKGLVGADGFKFCVYPNNPNYDKIPIKPELGERLFCSKEEARKAGWSCY